jgi:hypothetical protein
VTALPRQDGHDVMCIRSHADDRLPSQAGNGIAEVTLPRRNVDVESCWRQCYRVMLATALLRRGCYGTM